MADIFIFCKKMAWIQINILLCLPVCISWWFPKQFLHVLSHFTQCRNIFPGSCTGSLLSSLHCVLQVRPWPSQARSAAGHPLQRRGRAAGDEGVRVGWAIHYYAKTRNKEGIPSLICGGVEYKAIFFNKSIGHYVQASKTVHELVWRKFRIKIDPFRGKIFFTPLFGQSFCLFTSILRQNFPFTHPKICKWEIKK